MRPVKLMLNQAFTPSQRACRLYEVTRCTTTESPLGLRGKKVRAMRAQVWPLASID